MEQTEEIEKKDKKTGRKIVYPTWKSMTIDLLLRKIAKPGDYKVISKQVDMIFNQLAEFEKRNASFLPQIISKVIKDSGAKYKSGIPLEEIKDQIDNFIMGTNEFHTIYSIKEARYTYVSDKVEDILGIPKYKFTFYNLYSNAGKDKLNHPEDNYHVTRWGNLAYIVLSTPQLGFKANDDHYIVRHRIKSYKELDSITQEPTFVVVEKHCYLCHNAENKSELNPNLHIDRWVVLGEDDNFVVRPQFATGTGHQNTMNALLYLLNVAILDVSMKYLLLLNERLYTDRNKDVAIKVKSKVKHYTGIDISLEDQQVADCFGKTIRGKICSVMNRWAPLAKGSHSVYSDADAVKYAVKLGLVPIPKEIEALMFKNLTQTGKDLDGAKF